MRLPVLEGASQGVRDRISHATMIYISEFVAILQDNENLLPAADATRTEKEEKRKLINRRLQIAVAKWMTTVDLFPFFEQWEKKNGIPNFDVPEIVYKF